jgi:hypothetical protein
MTPICRSKVRALRSASCSLPSLVSGSATAPTEEHPIPSPSPSPSHHITPSRPIPLPDILVSRALSSPRSAAATISTSTWYTTATEEFATSTYTHTTYSGTTATARCPYARPASLPASPLSPVNGHDLHWRSARGRWLACRQNLRATTREGWMGRMAGREGKDVRGDQGPGE